MRVRGRRGLTGMLRAMQPGIVQVARALGSVGHRRALRVGTAGARRVRVSGRRQQGYSHVQARCRMCGWKRSTKSWQEICYVKKKNLQPWYVRAWSGDMKKEKVH